MKEIYEVVINDLCCCGNCLHNNSIMTECRERQRQTFGHESCKNWKYDGIKRLERQLGTEGGNNEIDQH